MESITGGVIATRPLVVMLMGPTASGKTDLALALCRRFQCEIISVDSAQIYRGMDIGSAKPNAELLRVAPHRLIDIRDPVESYSVAEFLADARREVSEIVQTGRIPLLVGGTMLYFKALLEGLANLPKSDPRLRAEIAAEAEREGWPALHRRLAALDPEAAARIHPNHSQRIARALEVCRLSGRSMSAMLKEQGDTASIRPLGEQFQILQLALFPEDRADLHRRIERRFHHMLELGFVGEVAGLRERADLHLGLPALRAVGYRQVWRYLDDEYDYVQMCEKGIAATRQLAKRQLTWLRKWSGLHRIRTPADTLRSDPMELGLPPHIMALLTQAAVP